MPKTVRVLTNDDTVTDFLFGIGMIASDRDGWYLDESSSTHTINGDLGDVELGKMNDP